jgi:hypothetical protein
MNIIPVYGRTVSPEGCSGGGRSGAGDDFDDEAFRAIPGTKKLLKIH